MEKVALRIHNGTSSPQALRQGGSQAVVAMRFAIGSCL
jgi:hypothetical protein